MLEIHQQKGEVVEDVDRGELVGEFEAVEQCRLALEQADITEVQVAVAAPHLSCCAPLVEQGADGNEPLQGFLADFINAIRVKPGVQRLSETAMVGLNDRRQRRCPAVIKASFGHQVEVGDLAGELVHQRRAQSAGLGEGVEQQCLLEASHDHEPIDRRLVCREADSPIRHTGKCAHFEIELGRGAAVPGELGLAGHPAPFCAAEIEVGIFHCALEFVGAVPGEEHKRGVSFDDIDPLHRRSVRGGRAQKIDDVALIIGHCRAGTARVLLPQIAGKSGAT